MTNRWSLLIIGFAWFASLRVAAAGSSGAVVFFGDSLTAGYGVDPSEAYPAHIEQRIRKNGWDFQVVNSGLSGETTAAGVRRVDWILRRPIAVFVLALGGNDGLRGIPVVETEKNLRTIIAMVRKEQPAARIVLAGMQAPPNMGPDFTAAFKLVFPRIAADESIPLVPFLLEGVGGEPEMNLPDGIHPNPEGHKIVAANVWETLEPVLKETCRAD